MAKFHINKKGVPSPCTAKQGKCPLGGNSGNENHFNSSEEAQDYIDNANSVKHGILPGIGGGGNDGGPPKIKNVVVDEDDYNFAFSESWNEHGYQVTGLHMTDFFESQYEGYDEEIHIKNIYDSLPEEFHNEVGHDDVWTLVPENNFEAHMSNHILVISHQEDTTAVESIIATIKKAEPKLTTGWGSSDELNDALVDDMSEFAANKLKEESTFSINGNRMTVFKPESENRNWAQEYIDEGKLDEWIKNNPEEIED